MFRVLQNTVFIFYILLEYRSLRFLDRTYSHGNATEKKYKVVSEAVYSNTLRHQKKKNLCYVAYISISKYFRSKKTCNYLII